MVVIDVLRAFSTAAYALAAGAAEIILVSTVEEALALRARHPGSFVIGEVGGLPVEGFDFSNSPSQITDVDLKDRLLIQRTSSGTQGVVRSARADVLLAASFVCARATARAIAGLNPQNVSFVISGLGKDGYGDEDAACADYIEDLLTGKPADVHDYLRRVRESPPGRIFADPARPEFPAADLDYCTQVDCFDFAMPVQRRDGLHVLELAKELNRR